MAIQLLVYCPLAVLFSLPHRPFFRRRSNLVLSAGLAIVKICLLATFREQAPQVSLGTCRLTMGELRFENHGDGSEKLGVKLRGLGLPSKTAALFWGVGGRGEKHDPSAVLQAASWRKRRGGRS